MQLRKLVPAEWAATVVCCIMQTMCREEPQHLPTCCMHPLHL